MDVEFHYYMTYLIAARAGFKPREAELIARSAESVDDNHLSYSIAGDPDNPPYQSLISQTMDIFKPRKELAHIYLAFHFIPGDQNAPGAARQDGRKDPWVTTPDSPQARKIIAAALASGNLYRIGIAAHAYADTWAHQNFIGRNDSFNSLWSLFGLPRNVGHAQAIHKPDKPGLIWIDRRLCNPVVNNRARFLDAAEAMFLLFAKHINPRISETELLKEAAALRADLDADIGPEDPDSNDLLQDQRIRRYCQRALQKEYGSHRLLPYVEFGWVDEAIKEDAAEIRHWLLQKYALVSDFVLGLFDDACGYAD